MPPHRPMVLRSFPGSRLALALLAALLLPAAVASAQDASRSDTLAPVSGTVFDSLTSKPLAGALVQVVARGENPKAWSATSDANGAFSFTGIPHGLFLVGFLHPELDSLGLGVAPHMLDVSNGAPVRLTLAIPSAPTIRKLLCTEAKQPGDSTGLHSDGLTFGSARFSLLERPVSCILADSPPLSSTCTMPVFSGVNRRVPVKGDAMSVADACEWRKVEYGGATFHLAGE